MLRNTYILFFCLLALVVRSTAQTDIYPGTWKMEYLSGTGKTPINIELQISAGDRNILYPAFLKLQCDSFNAEYELLLVRKNNWELAISKNKYPTSEIPFSLGASLFFLNGVFEYGKDMKGIPLLSTRRVQSRENLLKPADTANFTELQKITALRLRKFLKDADITLKKTNNEPWQHQDRDHILSPVSSPAYFGLLDTFHIQNRYGNIDLTGGKKTNFDIVSVGLNGHTVFEQVVLNKKKRGDDIILDTGLNILTFFADNFGNGLPNTGKLNLESTSEKLTLDFTNKVDSAASFIVARLYCQQDKARDISFQNNTIPGEEKSLKENERLIGSIIATSRQITLAVWDDAAEDGDSISISIDGKWLVQGFPVKKNPQFISVILQPGPNTIDFMADNLGSIPPNTSVLEIIDGKKRKSFFMETNLGENNLIKIFYDLTGTPGK